MKKTISFLISFLTLLFPFLSSGIPFSAESVFPAIVPSVAAGGYVLMEMQDRKILCESGAKTHLSPASTTKIMTCLVVLEQCSMDEEVIVAAEACGVEGSSAYLRAGEHLTVEELLYCLMLRSANDAAAALALHVAGSIENFAEMMNERAAALGLSDTHFQNPHGLTASGHYTCAADLATLTCCALNNEDFRKIVSTKNIVIGKDENRRVLSNHNRLLFSLNGCIGVKTGYTMEAGRCLVSACRRNDTTLVCVTLACSGDWAAHTALYEYGFKKIRRFTLDENEFALPFSESDIPLTVGHDSYTFLGSPDDTVEFSVVCPHILCAPVKEGEKVGYISVLLNGEEIDRIDILSKEERADSVSSGFFKKLIDFFLHLFKR